MHLRTYNHFPAGASSTERLSLLDTLYIYSLFGRIDPNQVFRLRFSGNEYLRELALSARAIDSRIVRISVLKMIVDKGTKRKLFLFQVKRTSIRSDSLDKRIKLLIREYDLLDVLTGFEILFNEGRVLAIYPIKQGSGIKALLSIDGEVVCLRLNKDGQRRFD